MRKLLMVLTAALALSLSGCGYNTFKTTDEQIKASWSEVINQYQRRADLVPNLVNTVKGEAGFEQDSPTQVIEARLKTSSIQAASELINDPSAFQKFQQAQGEWTGALSSSKRLSAPMVPLAGIVVGRISQYPAKVLRTLKSGQTHPHKTDQTGSVGLRHA